MINGIQNVFYAFIIDPTLGITNCRRPSKITAAILTAYQSQYRPSTHAFLCCEATVQLILKNREEKDVEEDELRKRALKKKHRRTRRKKKRKTRRRRKRRGGKKRLSRKQCHSLKQKHTKMAHQLHRAGQAIRVQCGMHGGDPGLGLTVAENSCQPKLSVRYSEKPILVKM